METENLPSIMDTSWVESLALDEINMEETGVVNFNHHIDPGYMVEESSIELMDELRERFEIYSMKFNQLRGSKGDNSQIKVFKISNTVNDFMLYRNALKLIIARKARDMISIGFLSNSGLYPARTSEGQSPQSLTHEIKAHVGPFNEITWRYQGEKINVDQVAKHYLTEFIRLSAR